MDKLPNKNPLFMIEEEQKEQVAKLNKMEREMEEVNYSVMQSDENIFSGDVVLDSFHKASRDEDNIVD